MSQILDLGGVTVMVRGLREDLDALIARQKLDMAQYVFHQIGSRVKQESVEYVVTKNLKSHKISGCFTGKTLKLRSEGETGLSWVRGESKVLGQDQTGLTTMDWYDDGYGTDQEKHPIKYLNDHADRLRKLYDDAHLLRNEKAVKLFALVDGQAFEPDFVLFLRRANRDKETIMQLFINPKSAPLASQDKWKKDLLKQLKNGAKMHVFDSRNRLQDTWATVL